MPITILDLVLLAVMLLSRLLAMVRGFMPQVLSSGPRSPMPITILALVLLAVMLISGLLAMVRGFMREILSIAAWGTAALVTLYAFSKLLPTAKTYFNNDTVAAVVVVAGVFVC